MIIRIESAGSKPAQQMIAALNAELEARYPGSPIFGIDAANFESSGGVFVVGYEDDQPVASGAFRPYENSAEIKRVYVIPAYRGRALAKAVMAFLEAEAVRRGYKHAVLETGIGQPEAIALYRSLGWNEIPPFGIYAAVNKHACFKTSHDFKSICFEKRLGEG
jgi:GNAT superfamily N-acetyltransferase